MKYNPYKYGWWSPTYIARRWSFSTRRQSIFYRSRFRIKETARNRGNEESAPTELGIHQVRILAKAKGYSTVRPRSFDQHFRLCALQRGNRGQIKKGAAKFAFFSKYEFLRESNGIRSSTICSFVYLSAFAQYFRKLHVLHNERNFWDDLMLATAIILHSITV